MWIPTDQFPDIESAYSPSQNGFFIRQDSPSGDFPWFLERYEARQRKRRNLGLFQQLFQKPEEATKPDKKSHLHPKENQLKSFIIPHPSYFQFSASSEAKHRLAQQGTKRDTMELNINFKTLIVSFFREYQILKEFNQTELNQIQQFTKRPPSFASLKAFFKKNSQNQKIIKTCLQFFSSANCLKKIMSGRCKKKSKLTMIKYIENIRLNLIKEQIHLWKLNKKGNVSSIVE